MSTDDCKDLINSVSQNYFLYANDKWKRVKKYKKNNLTLRDFKHI